LFTVTVTVAGVDDALPSLTTSRKVRAPPTPGDIKVGFADVLLLKVTLVPPVWDHK
jgi:hypothetical protein